MLPSEILEIEGRVDTCCPTFLMALSPLLADLISLEDAMDELELGPNGGLVYCMEYLLDNMDWLKDELDKFDDDEYIIFDCPGQVHGLAGVNRRIIRSF